LNKVTVLMEKYLKISLYLLMFILCLIISVILKVVYSINDIYALIPSILIGGVSVYMITIELFKEPQTLVVQQLPCYTVKVHEQEDSV
jgi:hypothetical protein